MNFCMKMTLDEALSLLAGVSEDGGTTSGLGTSLSQLHVLGVSIRHKTKEFQRGKDEEQS